MQGNQAYRLSGNQVDFIASTTTGQLMEDLAMVRMKESVNQVPKLTDALRERAGRSKSAAEKAFCADQIRQLEAYQAELRDFKLELPTITVDTSYALKDPAMDLHIDYHGHSHTAGDVFVFCPRQRAIATGDAIHGYFPNIYYGFPRVWPRTIDSVGQADFKYVLGGHGPVQSDRVVMTSFRNYIEELTEKVAAAKQAGQTVDEVQQRITVASLKSLQSNGYADFLTRAGAEMIPHFGLMPPLQMNVNENLRQVYANLDRV